MNMKQQLAMQAQYNRRAVGLEVDEAPTPQPEDNPPQSATPTRTDVARMSKARLIEELEDREMDTEGTADDLRERLSEELFG